jgi:hypothetical protein
MAEGDACLLDSNILLRYALSDPAGITVVPKDVSAPSKLRANRRRSLSACQLLAVFCSWER